MLYESYSDSAHLAVASQFKKVSKANECPKKYAKDCVTLGGRNATCKKNYIKHLKSYNIMQIIILH